MFERKILIKKTTSSKNAAIKSTATLKLLI